MKVWEQRQEEKGYLTWQEYIEAVEEDKQQREVRKCDARSVASR